MATKATKGTTKGKPTSKTGKSETPKETKVERLARQLAEAQAKEAAAKAKEEAKAKKSAPTPEPKDAPIQETSLAGFESGGALARATVDPKALIENAEVVALLPIKPDTLAQVQEALQNEGQQYPILIGSDDVIIDGHTRTRAAVALGWTEVAVHKLMIAGKSPEGLELALSLNSNKRHLSLGERRSLMNKLLVAHPEWSNGRIGRLSGLSGEAVRLRRNELVSEGKLSGSTKRVDAKGREVETGNIGSASSEGKGRTSKFPAVLLRMPNVDGMELPEEFSADDLAALLAWSEVIESILEEESEEE